MTWSHSSVDDFHNSAGAKTSRWWKIVVPIFLSARNLVSSFSGKLFKLLPPYVGF